MELGVILPNSGALATPDAIARIAERAEACGLDALWTSDHLCVPISSSENYPYAGDRRIQLDPDHGFVEPLIALSFAAARTQRIRLGVSVYLAALRHPLVCAKLLASLDQLAPGRVRLGVGAGWIPEEYALLGIAWHERGAVLDEHIQCLRALWSEARPVFRGRYYRVEGIGFEPKPAGGRIPILIGGNGTAALRRSARLGDGWHPIDMPAARLATALEQLDALCAARGRPRREIQLSMRCSLRITRRPLAEGEWPAPLHGTLDHVVGELQAYQRLGMDHAALWPVAREEGDLAGYLSRIEWIARELRPLLPRTTGSRS